MKVTKVSKDLNGKITVLKKVVAHVSTVKKSLEYSKEDEKKGKNFDQYR